MNPLVPHVRERLRLRRRELASRLIAVERDRSRASHALSADSGEQAVECENDEVLDRLSEVTTTELQQVQHALDRLEQGFYGICECCYSEIAAARLAALPEVTRCVRCAGGSTLAKR